VLRVCPKCLTASNEDIYCPNDGTKLIDPDELPASRRDKTANLGPSPLAYTSPRDVGDPLIGQLVAGRYRVLKQLGEGGMGNVYRGVQESIEKKIALKVLKAEYSQSPDMVVRFHREAVSACRIKHPNVVDVFDLGQLDDGRFYIAMDLLEGRDLAQLLSSSGPLSAQRAVHIALQICRALNAAHQSGIVHRDLKPENVFLHRTSDGDEIVKIVDFGIAHLVVQEPERARSVPTLERAPDGSRKLTSVGMIFGTPEYMAPEQATGGRIDHRADIYAVGVILYKALTGQAPFSGATFLDVLAKQVGEEPPRMSKVKPDLDIPRELENVVMRALAKKPDDRYATMTRFASALAYAVKTRERGRRTFARVAALGAVVAVAGVAGAWWWRHRSPNDTAQRDPNASTRLMGTEVPPPAVAPALPATVRGSESPAIASVAVTAATGSPPLPEVSAAPAVSLGEPKAARAAHPVPAKVERPPASAPRPQASPGTATTALPGLERCFETVAGERREVPCN
jgi:eukaryotic-like serine/threonine-protein kinase